MSLSNARVNLLKHLFKRNLLTLRSKRESYGPEMILRHEDTMLRKGTDIHKSFIKFRTYSPNDAQWMQEPKLKDYLVMLQDYKFLYNV